MIRRLIRAIRRARLRRQIDSQQAALAEIERVRQECASARSELIADLTIARRKLAALAQAAVNETTAANVRRINLREK